MESTEIEESFARRAIELARQARVAGDHPFGALLVLDGRRPKHCEDGWRPDGAC
jgi:tRNA(Arg) A34 adenosine deaminase TadA